ncbi:MAG: tellurite resistance TerB family protein [Methylococcales bacterium]|nr:tellurite resistance TerB family protein [Methylococcales bacterium]
MSFNNFLNNMKDKMSEMKTAALKFKNKEFLNAAMAGSALIALADGEISAPEKQKMVKFIETHEALSVFTTSDVIKAFQDYVSQIEFDKDIGDAKAYEAIRKLKSNDEAARLVMRMILSIAASDGNFDDDEKSVARKVAQELNLNASEFEL